MISIQIEPADNGVLKFLLDDNVNGGGEEYTTRTVYEFSGCGRNFRMTRFLNLKVFPDFERSTGNSKYHRNFRMTRFFEI